MSTYPFYKRANPPAPLAAPAPVAHPHDAVTGRAMDQLLNFMLLAGGGAALARTGTELYNRATAPSLRRKARTGADSLSRTTIVPLPYVKGADGDPGDSPGGALEPKPRGRSARLGRNIDPAANMRALGARKPAADPAAASAQRNKAIDANLAKTEANRRQPGYQASFQHANLNPMGQVASNMPTTPPPASASPLDALLAKHDGALGAIAGRQGASPLSRPPAAESGVRVAGGLQSSPAPFRNLPAMPAAKPAAPPPTIARTPALPNLPADVFAPPATAAPPPTMARQPGGAPPSSRPPLAGLIQPPRGGITPKGGDVEAATPGLKLAAEVAPPSGLAQVLTQGLGLARGGASADGAAATLRDWLNPADSTSIASMPWAWGALPPALALGFQAGYKPLDAAFKSLRKSDDKAELDEVKARYNRALRAAALSKQGSDDLDAAFEKSADLLDVPLGALAAIFTGATALGASHGWSKERAANSGAVLDAALKKRQAELFTKLPRTYLVQPARVTQRKRDKALSRVLATPEDEATF